MSTTIRAAEWTLSMETVDGTPRQPLYEAECATCYDTSEAHEGDRLTPEVWTTKHTARHPTHRTFRALITSFWRVPPSPAVRCTTQAWPEQATTTDELRKGVPGGVM